MRSLQGKRVLVTGAAAGIGRALAHRFAEEGAHLFLLDIDEAGLAEVVLAARRLGVEAYGQRCDVSQPKEISASTAAVLDRWGALDVLVNNAGIAYYGPTTKMSPWQWDQVLAVNLLAPVQFTRELLTTLLSRPEAHLLNVVSFYGFFPTARSTAYHVSKYGLLGLSEALRMEYGRKGLGVTALCPGFVRTALFDHMLTPDARREAPRPPRWLSTTPEKVAAKAIRAVYRNHGIALVTPVAHLSYHAKRLAPGVLDFLSQFGRASAMRRRAERQARLHEVDLAPRPRSFDVRLGADAPIYEASIRQALPKAA